MRPEEGDGGSNRDSAAILRPSRGFISARALLLVSDFCTCRRRGQDDESGQPHREVGGSDLMVHCGSEFVVAAGLDLQSSPAASSQAK